MVKLAILSIFALFLVLAIPVSADITYFDLSNPYNNTGVNDTTPDFSFRIRLNDSSTSSNCNLLVNGTGHGWNSSVENDTLTAITSNSSLSDGDYLWKLNCTTNDGFNQESIDRIFYVDTIAPNVTLVSPTPDDGASLSIYNANPSFTVNATYDDDGIVTGCSIIFNGISNEMAVHDGYCIGEAVYLQEGIYNYSVQVFDKANIGESDNRTISIDIVTFVEQNPVLALVIPLLWAVLAVFVFFIYDILHKLSHHQILQIGIGITIFMAFIISLGISLGLVI